MGPDQSGPGRSFASDDLRVGIDVVDIGEVAAAMAQFGDDYRHRIFDPIELRECPGQPEVIASALAARFAAKEAVRKLLHDDDLQPAWRDLGIHRASWGGCELVVSDRTAACFVAAGIRSVDLSLSHHGAWATAVAVGRTKEW